ncbi:MAG: HAMP domain-containing protein [Deltaproteobacteria bacterium]|nr:HAMP domain-containing protein [Deltaproteobacteria bacterium]
MTKSLLKLMVALSGLVVLVVGVSGVVAQRGLKNREIEQSARSLEAQASLVRELIHGRDLDSDDHANFDTIADHAAQAAGARVTLIDASGVVVGDSDVPIERLSMLENHGDRPEVRAALSGSVGQNARRSETVGRELLYLAVPVGESRVRVVRVAMELSDLESALAGLRNVLLVSGSIGLLAALALSYGLAWFTLRPVREVQRLTTAVADGNLEYRIPRRSRDELGAISDSIHRMADQLRERLEQANREKEQLRVVLNSMIEGVLVVDAEMNIVLANERLAALLGVRADTESLTLMEFARHVELEAVLREAASTDEPVSRMITVAHPAEKTLQVHAVRFPAGSGARLGTVAVLHDMTEIAQLDRVRREFVANASHELRTPLTAIQGFAETLLHSETFEDATSRSHVEVIDRHARRLGRLVADLLQLSETEGREAKLEPASVRVAALVDRVVRDFDAAFREKNIEVEQEAKDEPMAWADTHAVEQIVRNLLDNACQYTEAGGRVKLSVDGDEKWACIRVVDTGVGIPKSDLGRIFERFYRVDKARSRAAGGTGLGLSIVKHLVQSMNGEISVESALGRGSTFTLRLPRAKP